MGVHPHRTPYIQGYTEKDERCCLCRKAIRIGQMAQSMIKTVESRMLYTYRTAHYKCVVSRVVRA